MKKLFIGISVLAALVIGYAGYTIGSASAAPALAPIADVGTFGWGPGELIADLRFRDIDGDRGHFSDWRGNPATVLVVRDTDCPVSARYGPRIARMEEEFAEQGVEFVYVNFNPADTPERIAEVERDEFGLDGRYIHDPEAELGEALRIRATTEVIVLDPTLTIVYRGALDDQYGITYTKREVTEHYLRDAIEAALTGEPLDVRETEVPGCLLGHDEGELATHRDITYHNRVSRILDQNCVVCHREGGIGPMRLDSHQQASYYGEMIQYMVAEGLMPPWFASPEHGEFANERGLSERDRRDLFAWIDGGAPLGDPDEVHRPTVRTPGWNMGEPDAVVQIEDAFTIPAEGVVDYQYTYVKTEFDEDKWVEQMEIRPTAPEVVHHVLVFIEDPEVRERRRAGDRSARPQGGVAGYFASNVPGLDFNVFPDGAAKLLPKGAWLKFQLHFTPSGTEVVDQAMIGFKFADGPPERVVSTNSAYNVEFEIPAGAPDHQVIGEYEVKQAMVLLNLLPHMHLRGKAFRYDAIYPDGREEVLLDIPRYDFNWQLYYRFQDPPTLPAGTVIRATGWFDNSESNPWNPDPSIPVEFGEQTFEEMMIGYFDWMPPVAMADGSGDDDAASESQQE